MEKKALNFSTLSVVFMTKEEEEEVEERREKKTLFLNPLFLSSPPKAKLWVSKSVRFLAATPPPSLLLSLGHASLHSQTIISPHFTKIRCVRSRLVLLMACPVCHPPKRRKIAFYSLGESEGGGVSNFFLLLSKKKKKASPHARELLWEERERWGDE